MNLEVRTREQLRQSQLDTIHFSKPISDKSIVSRYTLGEKVTRENFTAMFIQSFAVSRAALAAQVAYLEWLRIHRGFDYRTTLENFRDADCLESLSDPEQERFENAFMRVKAHSKLRLDIALPHLVTQLLRPEYLELSQKYFAPEQYSSRRTFMDSLQQGITQLRRKDK